MQIKEIQERRSGSDGAMLRAVVRQPSTRSSSGGSDNAIG